MKRLAITLIGVMALARVALGDVVVLKDGTRIEGDVKRTADGWTIKAAGGSVRNVAADAVQSIELGDAAKSGSMEGLASLRRSVEALSDVNQIIDRYQRFIERTKEAQVIAEAQVDLASWRERRDRGLVKHGNKWVTPEEVVEISVKANATALEARDLIRQNRLKEADQLLQQAIADDPQNPAVSYLRGVMLYRQDKLSDARKSFEAVNAILSGHAPTLNNLAVVLWRQKQQPAALNYYDQAMQAQPVNKFILNNVAEALGAVSEEQRKTSAIAKVLRRFTEQDLILQQQMAQQGLFRWGSTWVDQKKLDELKAAEKEIHDKLDAMQQEFDQSKTRITQIDSEIKYNQQQMANIQSQCLFRDKDGNYVSIPLPAMYYDLQRGNQSLQVEQDSLRSKLTTMQEQAKRLRQQVPVPQFTGIHQLVGVEGTPLPKEAPGTQPASAPSTRSLLAE